MSPHFRTQGQRPALYRLPTRDSTQIFPQCISIMRFEIAIVGLLKFLKQHGS